jgi:hypothetical protein
MGHVLVSLCCKLPANAAVAPQQNSLMKQMERVGLKDPHRRGSHGMETPRPPLRMPTVPVGVGFVARGEPLES